jgi:tRNA(fMet)-specific endonuclease VapC
MVILDTDHLTVIQRRSLPAFFILSSRLGRLPLGDVCTTIVNVEEQMRGWLAVIRGSKKVQQEIAGYRKLHELFTFFAEIPVLDFDEAAAEQFARLRRSRSRIGSMDLKIAAIALSRHATLLSRNLGDFRQIVDLRVEDWTQRE